MSLKRVCVLSSPEGESLRRGEPVYCHNHKHIKEREADEMLQGYEPMAKLAQLPSERISKKHIIQIQEFKWRVVAQRSPLGGIGLSTWQLLPTNG